MRRPKITRSGLTFWTVLVLAAALVATVVYVLVLQNERIDALSAALADEQQATEDRGQTPVAPPPDDLIDEPESYEGPIEVGPTDEQVYAAVAAYFEVNPVQDGETPSPAELAEAVAQYLTDNPPEPGKRGPAPTAEQVAAAVEAYLIANPPAAGPQGERGPGPTPQEIAAGIETYLLEHPLPVCAEGTEPQAHTVLTLGSPVEAVICVVV